MGVDFQWMTGFECSSFPQTGADELEETQHYKWFASDLVRIRDTGIQVIRYGIPWPRVNTAPHVYDWEWVDQAVDLMETLGIVPIIDLFHFGTPIWIEGGIMNPIFGEIQGWYAKAFVQRYPQLLYYTPTNEPYIEATFGAEWAIWYPFLRGDRNAVRALMNVANGICHSMMEIRRVQPDAMMMTADTCEFYHSVEGAFQEEATFRSERRFLMHDLYQGLVNQNHPMWGYLTRNGIEDWELQWLLDNPVRLDILGLDYYRHSEHQLRAGPKGERIDEQVDDERMWGWGRIASQYSQRYNGIPVILAETNKGGPVEERVEWFENIVSETREARSKGVPIAGLTYYGAIDHVDWDSTLRERNHNINPCGMWGLHWEGTKLVRTPTALVDLYRRYINMPVEEAAGALIEPQAAARVKAIWTPAMRSIGEAEEPPAGRPGSEIANAK